MHPHNVPTACAHTLHPTRCAPTLRPNNFGTGLNLDEQFEHSLENSECTDDNDTEVTTLTQRTNKRHKNQQNKGLQDSPYEEDGNLGKPRPKP